MFRRTVIVLLVVTTCYCLENSDIESEERAKKKKSPAKLIGMILLLVLSKVAIFKAVSVFLMMTLFQKLFAMAAVFLKYYMRKDKPASVYGAPQYDTVGYSYGPPEEAMTMKEGYPGNDIVSSFDWLLNKNVK